MPRARGWFYEEKSETNRFYPSQLMRKISPSSACLGRLTGLEADRGVSPRL